MEEEEEKSGFVPERSSRSRSSCITDQQKSNKKCGVLNDEFLSSCLLLRCWSAKSDCPPHQKRDKIKTISSEEEHTIRAHTHKHIQNDANEHLFATRSRFFVFSVTRKQAKPVRRECRERDKSLCSKTSMRLPPEFYSTM